MINKQVADTDTPSRDAATYEQWSQPGLLVPTLAIERVRTDHPTETREDTNGRTWQMSSSRARPVGSRDSEPFGARNDTSRFRR